MPPWTDDELRTRARWILRSYRQWAGEDLVDAGDDEAAARTASRDDDDADPTGSRDDEAADRTGSRDDDDAAARALFTAPVAVLAHDRQDDPLCVYMNAAALGAFEMTLEQAAAFRTRQTAEPEARAERSAALAGAEEAGLVTGYRGVRVSSRGRRFRLLDGRIWTVLDDDGQPVGQAAAFVPGDL